jgi:hypothetical protein
MAAGGGPGKLPSALTEGFQAAFAVGAGFALLGLVLTLILIRNADSRASTQEAGLHEAGTAANAAA